MSACAVIGAVLAVLAYVCAGYAIAAAYATDAGPDNYALRVLGRAIRAALSPATWTLRVLTDLLVGD